MNTIHNFPNKINTVCIEVRMCYNSDEKTQEDYYLVIREPNGANRQELKFGSRVLYESKDPTRRSFVKWIDNRYFIISTGSRFGINPLECKDSDINWDPVVEIQHNIYKIPKNYLVRPIQVPEHLGNIPDLYDGDSKYQQHNMIPILDPRMCRIHSYWVNTGDNPINRKIHDQLNAVYNVKDNPYYNMVKEYEFAPEDPETPEYKDLEALKKLYPNKDIIWPLDAETKIQNYLTPKSRPYHEAMNALVCNLLAAANLHGFIFGGYVLGLIEHYHEYKADPAAEYRPPNDVDIWMSGKPNPAESVFSRNGLDWYVIANITEYLKVSGRKYKYLHDLENEHIIRYGVAKLLVDDTYRFDLVCNINNGCKFNTLADFSATNLYYKVAGTGELKLRTACGGFTLEQVLGHIRNRELRPIIEFKELFKYVGNQQEYDWYQAKFQKREKKVFDRGYKYPEGIVPLTEQYEPAMAPCLTEIQKRYE